MSWRGINVGSEQTVLLHLSATGQRDSHRSLHGKVCLVGSCAPRVWLLLNNGVIELGVRFAWLTQLRPVGVVLTGLVKTVFSGTLMPG